MKADFKFHNLLGTVYRQGDLVFTHDGSHLLSPVGNRVSVFDLVHNKSFTLDYEHRKNIATMDLNRQGTLLISVDQDGRAILVNFRSRTVLHHFNFQDRCYKIKFSPDGKWFAVTVGRFLQIWKTPSVTEDRQFAPFVRYRVHAGHFQDLLSLSWSYDGRFILTTSKDLTTRLWSVYSEDRELASTTFAGHRDYVMGAFFSHDQEKIYTLGKDGALFQWEYTTKGENEDQEAEPDLSKYRWRITNKHFCFNGRNKVKCVSFHAASNLLIIGFDNGEFRIYELPHFTLLQQLSMGQNPVDTVTINSTGEWLAFGSRQLGQLLVYEWQSESYVLKQQGHFDSMNSLTYSPDGSRVVTASDDGKIKVWDVVSGFCIVTLEGHTSSVTSIQFAKRGQVLFTASLDGTVRAWDLIRYRNFRVFTSVERIQFSCVAVDPSGEIVCAGSTDSFDIHVWSVQTGQLVDQLAGHEGPVSCLSFSQETGTLASASWDRTIRVWSIFGRSQQVEPIEVFSDVLAISTRPDGEQVACSTLHGQLTIFDIASARQVGNIDCRKDIISGRHLEDRFTARNSQRSKFFTTINYSFDGSAIVAGGNNNSICLYDVANEVLLRRFVVSKNMNLNGTLEFLNSKRLTEAGSLDLIDDAGENSDLEDRIDNSLPGSNRGGDLSTRRVRPEVRVTSIQFSPTATAFAAASTEGLLVYSIDDTMVFDPFDLDVDVTPQTTLESLNNKSYLESLVMAFRLNEDYLIQRVYEAIPASQINLVSNSLPTVYVGRILKFIADYAMESQHIEFNLLWIKALLCTHGSYMNLHKRDFSSAMRSIQRFLGRVAKDVVTTSKTNTYAYRFLTSTKDDVDGAGDEQDKNGGSSSEGENGLNGLDEDEKMTDHEDEEEWQGFEDKKKQLPLQDDGESDDEEDLI